MFLVFSWNCDTSVLPLHPSHYVSHFKSGAFTLTAETDKVGKVRLWQNELVGFSSTILHLANFSFYHRPQLGDWHREVRADKT